MHCLGSLEQGVCFDSLGICTAVVFAKPLFQDEEKREDEWEEEQVKREVKRSRSLCHFHSFSGDKICSGFQR